jgi:cysteine desulfurase
MIYLDHSATTPTDPRVVDAMLPYFTEIYGNASSAHSIGRTAERAIEDARAAIARVLNCQPHEIIFTSGGSESDNLAVRGVGRPMITTPLEHGAIGKTVNELAKRCGILRTILPVDAHGVVSFKDFAAVCESGAGFASIMYANNEVGTIQPIAGLAHIARQHGVLFHTDAVQAAGQLPLDVQRLGVDLLSLSAHKFYGPKGIGALYVRDGVEISPTQTGGGQERGLRAGTYSTPLIVGLAKALELAYSEYEERQAHFQTLRDTLINGVLSTIPGVYLTGHPTQRLPTHASFVFEGIPGGLLVSSLDSAGIAASSASACKAGSVEPSSVLLALGYPPELATASLRLTVGIKTTLRDIEYTIDSLAGVVAKLRQFKAALAV